MLLPLPFSDFLSLSDYHFRRPFYESKGYVVVQKDGGLIVYVNALGISPDDIDVKIEPTSYGGHILRVSGKTNNEDLNYDFETKIGLRITQPLADEVKWEAKDGLVKIYLDFEKPINAIKVVRK